MSKCWYCNEELTTGNNPEHIGICDKCYDEMFKYGNDFVKVLTNKIADLEAKLAEGEIRSKEREIFYKREINRRDTKLRNIKQQLAEMTEKYKASQEARKFEIEDKKQSFKERTDIIVKLEKQLADTEFRYENLHNLYYKDTEELKQKLAQARENLTQCDADRKFEEEKKNIAKRRISELKQQLAEKEKVCDWLDNVLKEYAKQEELLSQKLKSLGVDCIEDLGKTQNQDKISFAVEQLEQLRIKIKNRVEDWNSGVDYEFTDMLPDYDIYEEIDNQIKELKEGK